MKNLGLRLRFKTQTFRFSLPGNGLGFCLFDCFLCFTFLYLLGTLISTLPCSVDLSHLPAWDQKVCEKQMEVWEPNSHSVAQFSSSSSFSGSELAPYVHLQNGQIIEYKF